MNKQLFLVKKGSLEKHIAPKLYSALDAFRVMKNIGTGKSLEDVFVEVELVPVVKDNDLCPTHKVPFVTQTKCPECDKDSIREHAAHH